MAATVSSIRNILEQTAQFEQSLTGRFRHTSSVIKHVQQHGCPPSVNLPKPPCLRDALLSVGAPSNVANEMECVYQSRASAFRDRSTVILNRTCHELSKLPVTNSCHPNLQKVISVFTALYTQKLETWLAEGLAKFQQHAAASAVTARRTAAGVLAQQSVKTFNYEYVPLLEHFFAENPFPTHADKAFLAKKSGMTYRQIHVWNRRNRSKNRKTLRRKPMSEGANLPLDDLYRRMSKFIVPNTEYCGSQSPSHSEPPRTVAPTSVPYSPTLDSPAPPHAFPSTYPPACSYDPFPKTNGQYRFAKPEWMRLPACSIKQRASTVDLTEVIELFSQLNVRGDSSHRSRKDQLAHVSLAATESITVKPYPAPLPAFVPKHVEAYLPICHPLPTIPASSSQLHVFRSPSPLSHPTTLVPPRLEQAKSFRHRKLAPLPRRLPSKGNCAHRTSSATTCSPSPMSRTLSFTSEASSSESIFTPDDSASAPSSGISTPERPPFLLAQPNKPLLPLFGSSFGFNDSFSSQLLAPTFS
ncbi:hypothetical protein BDN67DRAFT_1006520 [Paxillus ammoniavirescens]|nr:hypothetical protein BDN67DRAFT_1006520 [Paxillus ammoniavirescens]